MQLTQVKVFDLTNALKNIGGLWKVISIFFGAIIFHILQRFFWSDFATFIRKMKGDSSLRNSAHLVQTLENYKGENYEKYATKMLAKKIRHKFSYEYLHDHMHRHKVLE